MNCINKSSKEFKSLQEEVGYNDFVLGYKIAKWQDETGLARFPTKNEMMSFSNVTFELKAVGILSSDKAEQVFAKGKKNGWDLNKILTELQVPKDQKQIILVKNIKDREEIITSLLAENSFVVEVNTSKNDASEMDFNKPDEIGTFKNSSYYSNLTVPGGTNYTENEIATPAITPNIKGHAQFATDNGIGWFRSDDKAKKGETFGSQFSGYVKISESTVTDKADIDDLKEDLIDGKITSEKFTKLTGLTNISQSEDNSKTRRILEVQSDLFQKGRSKKMLEQLEDKINNNVYNKFVENTSEEMKPYLSKVRLKEFTELKSKISLVLELLKTKTEEQILKEDNYNVDKLDEEIMVYINEGYENYSTKVKQEQAVQYLNEPNQFLQLLNKKGNWVNFFIQSIIQDSVKKGYEKVLFPSGETAAKIEGHQTIADEIISKQDGLKSFKEKLQTLKDSPISTIKEVDGSFILEFNSFALGTFVGSTKEEVINIYNAQFAKISKDIQKREEDIKNYKEQGLEKLKPIEAFYTNRVTNILNKLYDVKVITDEHGNTWNEVNLNDKRSKTNIFYLNKKLINLVDNSLNDIVPNEKETIKENKKQEEKNTVINDIFNGNVNTINSSKTILENILNNVDNLDATTIKIIKALIANTSSVITFKSISDPTIPMRYNPAKNEIIIDVSKFKNKNYSIDSIISNIVHEVTHEFAHKALDKPSSINEKMFSNEVNDVYNKYKTLYKQSGKNNYDITFSSVDEFLSDLLSEPAFVKELNELNPDNSLWKQIISVFRSLFGLKNTNDINDLINDFITFSSEFTYEYYGNSNFYNKTTAEESKKKVEINLKTTQDKYEDLAHKMLTSLDLNIKSFNKASLMVSHKNKEQGQKIKKYANELQEVKDNISKYKDSNIALVLTNYAKSMSESLNVINSRFDKIDYDNPSESQQIYDIYNNYLITYSVSDEIQKLILYVEQDVRNNVESPILTKEEITDIKEVLQVATSSYSVITTKTELIIENILTKDFNNIQYYPEIINDFEDLLAKRHKELNIIENKKQWINKQLHSEDIQKQIQEKLNDKVLDTIYNPLLDIMQIKGNLGTSVNIDNKIIKIITKMIDKIQIERYQTEKEMDVKFLDLKTKLEAEKGTNNIKKLYEKLYQTDKNGKYVFKGVYHIDLHTDIITKIRELSDKRRVLLEERKSKTDALLIKGFNYTTAEYKEVDKEYENKINSIDKESLKLKENNFELDINNKIIKPKDKWKNNLSDLSKLELEILDFLINQTEKNDKYYNNKSKSTMYFRKIKFYNLPKIHKSLVERAWTNTLKGVAKDTLKEREERTDDFGFNTVFTDFNGMKIRNLKIHYRDPLGTFDNKNQSLDVIGMMRSDSKAANAYMVRKEYESKLNMILQFSKNKDYKENTVTNYINVSSTTKKIKTIDGKIANTPNFIEHLLESHLYDILHHTGEGASSIAVNKAVGFINKSAAFLDLSLNIASGTANVVNTAGQLFIKSFIKGKHIKATSIAKANLLYTKHMATTLKDNTRGINMSYVNQINEMFNISGSFEMAKADFLKTDILKKTLNLNSFGIFQNSGEHWMASTIAMATLDGVKVMNAKSQFIDVKGNIVNDKDKAASILDMLELDSKTGLLQLNSKIIYTTHSKVTKWSEGGNSDVKILIKKMLFDLTGNYMQLEQPKLNKHWYGKLIGLYKKFLIPMGVARLRGVETSFIKKEDLSEDQKNYSDALKEYEEGTYTTLIRFLVTSIKDKKLELLTKNWNNLSDLEKLNIKDSVIEIVMTTVILPLLVSLLKGMDDDDDGVIQFVIYQLNRLEMELSAYRYPPEMLKMLKSPFASARLLDTTASILYDTVNFMNWEDEYETGKLKGENKYLYKVNKKLNVFNKLDRDWKELNSYFNY